MVYRKGYKSTKGKGRAATVLCSLCGKKVPRFKTITTYRGFGITDPTVLHEVKKENVHLWQRKQYLCPACARFHHIVGGRGR
jgi:small subunit ribosomal protein S26e